MAAKALPELAYLVECFDLDRATGVLTWRERPRHHFPKEHGWNVFNSQLAGKRAGTPTIGGYYAVAINGKKYFVHRIVWVMSGNSDEPNSQLDHINHDRAD